MATVPSRSRSSRPSSAAESWPSCRARRRRKAWSQARSDQGHADRRERSYERRPRAGRAGRHGQPARRAPWLRQVVRAPTRCYISAAGHPGVPGRVLVRRLRLRRAGRARRPSRWRHGRRRRTRRWPTHAGPGVVAYSALGQADGHPRAVTPRYCSRTLEMPLCERFPLVAWTWPCRASIALPGVVLALAGRPSRAVLVRPACPGQRAGGTAGCSPKKRMNSALASGPRGSV